MFVATVDDEEDKLTEFVPVVSVNVENDRVIDFDLLEKRRVFIDT